MAPALYRGIVTHKRMRPFGHELSYNVMAMLVDVDDLEAFSQRCALFSYNHFNLFSISDRDHGTQPGLTVSEFAWREAGRLGNGRTIQAISMLCYPRISGYSFNPLTTYFCYDHEQLVMVLHEVHNTFGGRHVYASYPGDAPGAYGTVEKVFAVSPFNGISGHYHLRTTAPSDTVALGVALADDNGPILKAYFSGKRHEATNFELLKTFVAYPLMGFKIIAAIHWEALKLWVKGLKIQY